MRRALVLAALLSVLCVGYANGSSWRIPKAGITVIDATVWPAEVERLVAKWDVLPLTVEPGPCEWKRGAIVLCAGHYGVSSGAAGGLLKERGQRIVAGKVAFNLDYSAYDIPELREWLLCHEFGHMLGLLHDDVPLTAPDAAYHHGCMNTVWQGEPNPSQYDLEQLR